MTVATPLVPYQAAIRMGCSDLRYHWAVMREKRGTREISPVPACGPHATYSSQPQRDERRIGSCRCRGSWWRRPCTLRRDHAKTRKVIRGRAGTRTMM